VLAIEAARAGSATGEVTSVLRTLPSGKQRRVPFRARHTLAAALLVLVVLAAVGGGVAWLVTRTHHGTGKLTAKSAPRALTQVVLCQSCASGFNPLGSPTNEHPDASLAIDNQLNTVWNTQTYYDGKLDKQGTGIYVDASPGTTARVMRIITDTPGFTATIYARTTPPPIRWPDPGWVAISGATTVSHDDEIHLASGSARYRFFLVWITNLGPHNSLAIDELALYR
jgi:eukaryotic-like serine/threonine-protein kinase